MADIHIMASWIPLEEREKITNEWYPVVRNGGGNYQEALKELFRVYNEYLYSGQNIECAGCRSKIIHHYGLIIARWTAE